MKKSSRKKLLSIFALTLSCCAVSAVGALTASASDGDTVTVEDTAGNFYMEKGASVRMDKDRPGIRWTTHITEAYYGALVAEYSDDVRLATQVTIEGKSTQTIYCTSDVIFENGVFTYYAALTFEKDETGENGLTSAEIEQAKEWQITAQAVAIDNAADEDKTNDTVVQNAVAEDTTRSMKAVANAAKLAGENEGGILDNYVGDATVNETTSFYDTSDTTNTSVEVALDVEDGTDIEAYVGAKQVTLDVTDGKATIDANNFVGVEAGDLGYVSIFTNDGKIKATPVRFAHKFISSQADLNKVLINNTTITGYYVLANDIEVTGTNPWRNCYNDGTLNTETHTVGTNTGGGATGMRENHYGMVFDGTFDGNGHTITAPSVLDGIFGETSGTVKNVNLEIAITEDPSGYGAREAILSRAGKGSGTFENVNVKLTAQTAGLYKAQFSLFGNAASSNYKLIRNVVVDCGDVISAEATDSGILFLDKVTTANVQNVYVISSSYEMVAKDVYAVNKEGEDLTTLENVRRYDSLTDMANDNEDEISGFDSAWWDMTSGLPIWKATTNMDDFVEWEINYAVSDFDSILLNTETKEARIYLTYGKYIRQAPTLTATTDGIVEIAGNLMTAASDGTTEVLASWATPNGDKTIEKTFTVTVAQSVKFEGANVRFAPKSDGSFYIDLPEAMEQEAANITSIQNITDSATVYEGTTWTADTLANDTNAVIEKEIKIEFADGTAYLAKMDCYTKAIASQDDMNAILIKNATTKGAYILVDNITVTSWNNSGGNSNHHYLMVFEGLFEGNGKTITANPVSCGIFGQLQGTVQNLNVVFTITKAEDFSYAERDGLISYAGKGTGVIRNLNVKLTGNAGIVTNGISLFGTSPDYSKYALIENVVADFGNVVSSNLTRSTYGLLLASGSITSINNVYIISSTLKVLIHDGTNDYYAENEDGQTLTITGVKRFDSWTDLTRDTNFDVSNYDPAFWAQYYD